MKKLYSIICFLLIAGFGFSQVLNVNPEVVKQKNQIKKSLQIAPRAVKITTIFSEDFEGGSMPTGWTEELNGATTGWTFNTDASSDYFTVPAHTTYAAINDDDCNCTMSDVWLITPAIDLSTATSPQMSFQSFLHIYVDVFTLKASIDGGTTWTDVTTFTTEDAWTEENVDLTAYAGESLMLAFHYNDGDDWGYGWAIDDVVIYEPDPHDLGVTALVPAYVVSGSTVAPQALVHNYGGTDETTWSIQLTDGMGYDETVVDDGTIVAGEDYVVTFPDWTPADGTYTLTATVTVTDDAVPTNDELAITSIIDAFIVAQGANSAGSNGTWLMGTNTWETYFEAGTSIYGGTLKDGLLYCVDDSGNFGYFDAACEAWTQIGATGISGETFIISMAYDPVGDMFYTLGLSGSYPTFNINLYSIDQATGTATLIGAGSSTGTLLAIACDNAGNMFGVMHSDSGNGSLYAIDKTDATMTLVGDMGDVVSSYFQSMAFDFDSNVCYLQAFDDEGGLNGTYTIDVASGAPTFVGYAAFPSQLTAIGIPYTSTGVEPIVTDSNISVYPNPANNVINIVNAENANIVVLNMVGEIVATVNNASANQTIDISNLADGTYFVRVNDEVIKINVIK